MSANSLALGELTGSMRLRRGQIYQMGGEMACVVHTDKKTVSTVCAHGWDATTSVNAVLAKEVGQLADVWRRFDTIPASMDRQGDWFNRCHFDDKH